MTTNTSQFDEIRSRIAHVERMSQELDGRRHLLQELSEASAAIGVQLTELAGAWQQIDGALRRLAAVESAAPEPPAPTAAPPVALAAVPTATPPSAPAPVQAAPPSPPAAPAAAPPPASDPVQAAPAVAAPAAPSPAAPPPAAERAITVTAGPFADVAMVSVVEEALRQVPGVHTVALRELRERQALIDVTATPDVALIAGLRKTLSLAFDIADSSEHALDVRLVQPAPSAGDAASAPEAQADAATR